MRVKLAATRWSVCGTTRMKSQPALPRCWLTVLRFWSNHIWHSRCYHSITIRSNGMKVVVCSCLILSTALAAFASEETADRKSANDQKALQGDWIPLKAELAGQPMPDAVLKTI